MGMLALAALGGSAMATAGAAIQSGNRQAEWSNYQSRQLQADAAAEKGAAHVRAENIRKLGDRQRSAARASMAASGVDVGGIGTPLLIDSDIAAGAEHDAFMTLLGADDASRRAGQQARGLQIQGRRAQTAGYTQAATSLLSTAGSMGMSGGWSMSGGRS